MDVGTCQRAAQKEASRTASQRRIAGLARVARTLRARSPTLARLLKVGGAQGRSGTLDWLGLGYDAPGWLGGREEGREPVPWWLEQVEEESQADWVGAR